jgi:hypothetical protein
MRSSRRKGAMIQPDDRDAKEVKRLKELRVEKDFSFGNNNKYAKCTGFKNENQFAGGEVKDINFPKKSSNWMMGFIALSHPWVTTLLGRKDHLLEEKETRAVRDRQLG